MHLPRTIAAALIAACSALTGCGGRTAYVPPPIQLSVSLVPTVPITANGTPIGVQVTIQAPTETATFSLTGLPSGLSWTYKESESNPSGLLTLTAAKNTVAGTYKCTITVGSSAQTASTTFNLVVTAPSN
jgi:hypothetical protein